MREHLIQPSDLSSEFQAWHSSYQGMLTHALTNRAKRNSRFSLRAFAKQIQVQPSQLSRVLGGKARFSETAAKRIAKKAFDSEIQQELFVKLVQVSGSPARDSEQLSCAIRRLTALLDEKIVDPAVSLPFESWKDFVILEMTELKSFQPTPKWIGNFLAIDEAEAARLVARLLDVGLLKAVTRNGLTTLVKSNLKIETKDGVPSQVMRRIQSQFLAQAMAAMDAQALDRRKFQMRTVALREQDWPRLKALASKFFADVSKLTFYEKDDNGESHGDRIMQIQLQMFGVESGDQKR